MRDIKYRAWDGDRRRFVAVTGLRAPDGVVKAVLWYNFPTREVETLRNFELLEYTGLKDKNGREIYEGDIIPISNETETRNAYVEFYDGAFVIAGPAADGSGEILRALLGELVDEYKATEVIGNIYENPELLERAA